MRPGRILLLALAVSVATALADAAPRRAASAKGPSEAASSDLFGGYSYTHAGEASLNGWGLSGSYRLHLRLLHGQGTWDTDPRFSVGVVYRLRR